MVTIAVFPGQGAQAVGMGKQLYDQYPAAKEVFDTVDAALGQKLSDIIFDGPSETLTATENAQPALMACSIAAVRAFEAETGQKLADAANYVAGHSLGEYSALCAAGAVSLEDTAKLLRLRGAAMQRAVAVGDGAMAAIMGLSPAAIDALLDTLDAGVVVLANDNSDGQAVLSGAKTAVEAAAKAAKDAGAKRALMLDVSAPFHCPLMQPATEELAPALSAIRWQTPTMPVIANVTAQPNADPGQFTALLTEQVTGQVRWRESMTTMQTLGASKIIEFGAGKVLSGLTKRALKGAACKAIGTPDDLAGINDWLAA